MDGMGGKGGKEMEDFFDVGVVGVDEDWIGLDAGGIRT